MILLVRMPLLVWNVHQKTPLYCDPGSPHPNLPSGCCQPAIRNTCSGILATAVRYEHDKLSPLQAAITRCRSPFVGQAWLESNSDSSKPRNPQHSVHICLIHRVHHCRQEQRDRVTETYVFVAPQRPQACTAVHNHACHASYLVLKSITVAPAVSIPVASL